MIAGELQQTLSANLSEQTKQMIVLTHKKDFLRLLSKKLDSVKVLSLKKDIAKGSLFIPFDIESEFKSDHQKRIEGLIEIPK